VTESELNEALVRGLTEAFGSRVLWMTNAVPPEAETEPGLRRATIYDDGVGYLGIGGVAGGLADEIAMAMAGLRSSNELTGWVLDLRFSGGRDYRVAASVADQFVEGGRPLVRFDDTEVSSTGEGDAKYPVVILVNSETKGAAEALAGALREAGPAVILGSPTAGQAQSMRAFDLEQGGQLFIASAPVQVGEGVDLDNGVIPDFEVASPLAQERRWLEDPYRAPDGEDSTTAESTNRINEAALVAQHGGVTNPPVTPGPFLPADDTEPAPVVRDPAMVRAMALLKGLARVRGGVLR
jgi:C-terminal processing protease CtpA/Prc